MLVRDGQPAATIVTAAAATDAAAFAAQELQYHVQKITGATLPIKSDGEKVEGPRILVGPSAATAQLGLEESQFKDQEYLIRFVDNTLILLGKDAPSADERREGQELVGSRQGDVRIPPPPMFDDQATSYAVHDFPGTILRCPLVRAGRVADGFAENGHAGRPTARDPSRAGLRLAHRVLPEFGTLDDGTRTVQPAERARYGPVLGPAAGGRRGVCLQSFVVRLLRSLLEEEPEMPGGVCRRASRLVCPGLLGERAGGTAGSRRRCAIPIRV